MDELFNYYDTGIESYWQYLVKNAGPYADLLEAKYAWWDYCLMCDKVRADEVGEENIPDEIYDLKDSWW